MSKQKPLYIILSLLAIAVIIVIASNSHKTVEPEITATQTKAAEATTPTVVPIKKVSLLHEPLNNALARITKKPFGIYITKKNSPVQPERFSGYHSGVDFETYPNEQKTDVIIFAVCDGPLRIKKWATGYGGVAVQQCKLDNRDVTIIYGHMRLASVTSKVGTVLKAGDKLGVLGIPYSSETDGERRHLHLGIHIGTSISILGYVQAQKDLANWLDAKKYLQ